MKLLFVASFLLLGVFISPALSTPYPSESRPLNPIPTSLLHRTLIGRNAVNTCSASSIRSAERHANHGPRTTISSLCSSLQGKYKTVTHSIYTTTATPKTTIATVTTAPRGVVSQTVTAQVTQTSTDVEGSTVYTTFDDIVTETTIVETDTATVTAPVLRERNQYPCQQIESILSLPAGSATPFCSCYNTGPTSTKTVTCDGATTATPVRVTSYTKTVTPTPSTYVTSVYQTTTVITTVYSGTVVTSTVTEDVFTSVT